MKITAFWDVTLCTLVDTYLSERNLLHCRSQWPRGLRHEMSLPAWTLGSWVSIPLGAWMFVCFYSVFVLSCVGSGLATAWSLVQGVLPTVSKCKITEPRKEEAKARNGLERHIRRRRRIFIKDGDSKIFRNVLKHLSDCMASHSRSYKLRSHFQENLKYHGTGIVYEHYTVRKCLKSNFQSGILTRI
jgi:hypothetical protein